MQKLLIPFKSQMMLCGYKNTMYKNYWGYPHYGVDISTIQGGAGSDNTVYGSGNGIVVASGQDNRLGYGVAIFYKDCLNHKTGEVYDLIARYIHMKTVYVKTGDVVTSSTKIGVEGKEGTGDYHLHIEFDRDIKYPTYSPQVSMQSTFWKKGTDTTVNPSFIFHASADRKNVDPTYNPEWLNMEDFKIPFLAVDVNYKMLYDEQLEIGKKQVDKLQRIKLILEE